MAVTPEGRGWMPAKPRPGPERDPELIRDAHDLQRAVSDLVRIYQFRDRTSICYHDISVTQCHALSAVVEHGPMMLNQLAEGLYLDKSTASRVVASLVDKGYIRRSPDPGDARALSLEATRAGRGLHARILEDLEREMLALIADQEPATRRATIELVARLAAAAEAKFGRRGAACSPEE
jgi:MarR family 2-MHQ and catechol resistance regulon transcriptional repressor